MEKIKVQHSYINSSWDRTEQWKACAEAAVERFLIVARLYIF
jgi:hypothetical protein